VKYVISAIVVVLIVVGAVFAFSGEDGMQDDAMMEKDGMMSTSSEEGDAMMEKEGEMMEEGSMMEKSGSYETYVANKVAAAASKGDVVLFFRASWCPTCRALDADIRSHMDDIPAGLTILDVDYDNSGELKEKYGVTHQHTLVQVDAQGNLVKKWEQSPTLATLVAQVI
jgi:thiol-disulfide isomerase/thioredoxin